ncbi:MAG: hypothetical protein MUC66_00380 [Methanolinea sp.]|jgi:hypothetical protein|nr:hypothetical protein [Methanolinea sp.]
MTERRLFILLEGNDDERFFSRVVVPLLAPRYRSVRVVKYACLKRSRVCRFVRSFQRTGDEYMVVADIDQAPGVKAKKDAVMGRFCVLKPSDIVVIIQEIESWYLAGLETSDARRLGVNPLPSTDHVTKEDFNTTIPPQYVSRIAYMLEILSRFSIAAACRKNRSFHYFMTHYHLARDIPSLQVVADTTGRGGEHQEGSQGEASSRTGEDSTDPEVGRGKPGTL